MMSDTEYHLLPEQKPAFGLPGALPFLPFSYLSTKRGMTLRSSLRYSIEYPLVEEILEAEENLPALCSILEELGIVLCRISAIDLYH